MCVQTYHNELFNQFEMIQHQNKLLSVPRISSKIGKIIIITKVAQFNPREGNLGSEGIICASPGYTGVKLDRG